MLKVTVIKSTSHCSTCDETAMLVKEISETFKGQVECQIVVNGTPEAMEFGIVTTPVVALGNKIYSMGKPVIKQKVEGWIRKELGI